MKIYRTLSALVMVGIAGCVPSTVSYVYVQEANGHSCELVVEQALVSVGLNISRPNEAPKEIQSRLNQNTLLLFDGAPALGVFGNVERDDNLKKLMIAFLERSREFSPQALSIRGALVERLQAECGTVDVREKRED